MSLKYVRYSVIASLVVLILLLNPCCAEKVDEQSYDLEELAPASSEDVVMVAVGDVMLSRMVGETIREKDDPEIPFVETAGILQEADIAFCNLESPFYEEGLPVEGEMVFGAAPETVEGLKYAGFDVVSLANNHFGDQGLDAMLFTLSHLNENGIEYTGAGESGLQAREPAIIESNGVKFAFLGYCDIKSAAKQRYFASSGKPGTAELTEENLTRDIQRARERAHVVIVSIHWGKEYEELPTERQKTFAHMAIDSGALLVLGHHPHVVQPVVKYKDGYIFYSLANFVFDQMWSEETTKGLMVKILFKGDRIEKVEMIKTVINDLYQPCTEDRE
ncbi:CapA family protein [Chloroflexota bacterium]